MPSNHQRRRSIRLPDYDYTQPGHYFVTICTSHRQNVFANPHLRTIAESQWRDLRRMPANARIDTWIVMDNHVHAIIEIRSDRRDDERDERDDGGAQRAPSSLAPDAINENHRKPAQARSMVALAAPLRGNIVTTAPLRDDTALAAPLRGNGDGKDKHGGRDGLGINVAPGSLGAIVRAYKAAVTLRANNLHNTPGARVWQRGYWEKIIRDEQHLARVRHYVAENPARHAAHRAELAGVLDRMTRHQ